MPAILMVVNIEFHRYHRHDMAKSNDPDIQLLAALADPTRMEISARELAGAPEVCACDFTSCCDVSQPTVSHHLKVLRDAGAVVSERRGNWVFYKIAPNLGDRLAGITGGLVPGAGVLISTLAARPRAPAPGRSSSRSSSARARADLASLLRGAPPAPRGSVLRSRPGRVGKTARRSSSVPVAAAGSSNRQLQRRRAGEVRTGLPGLVADRDGEVECLADEAIEALARLGGDVDPELGHRADRSGRTSVASTPALSTS